MLAHYLKLAYRNLQKQIQFTLLNVLGLSLGLTVSLLLFLHIQQEQSFDQYHSKAARIHRVILNASWDGGPAQQLATAPNAIGPALTTHVTGVEQASRLLKHEFGQSAFITAGDKKLVEENLYWADPSFFQIFDIQAVEGDLATALQQPYTVALSQSAATRYFGTTSPLGKFIQVDQMEPLEIKAVYADFPDHSTFDAAVLGSFSSVKWASQKLTWSNASFETWVLLQPNVKPETATQQLADLLDKNVPKDVQRYSMWLQNLSAVHLQSTDFQNNYSKRMGDPKQVQILSVLALAILLIACFNYMNLATARAQLRFREVGINKTMGASRAQLSLRFYLETALMVAAAMIISIAMLLVAIPAFNHLADKHLTFSMLYDANILMALGGISILTILLAGAYPAFFLASFLPKNLLNTSFRSGAGAGFLRRVLVTLQFAASVTLMIGTLVLYRQMQFIQQKKLGFAPEQVVAINISAAESRAQLDALMQSCRGLSTVMDVCRAQTYPGGQASGRVLRKNSMDSNGLNLQTNATTPGIEKVLKMNLLAGTGLPEKLKTDTIIHVLLNKTAVDYLGMSPEEAVGKEVDCDLRYPAVVAGVVADFHANSLHEPIGAYAFHDALSESRRFLMVKLNTQNLPETMRQLEAVFLQNMPQSALEFNFLDAHLASLYRSEQRTAKVVLVFSILSILISCLGLFGLAAFAAEQRRKEIGVRRVLGASAASITGLLAKDFVKLVLLAFVLAAPLAWQLMQMWLQDFTYHIELQGWMFALAGILAVILAFITVSFQSIKAALRNPVEALRSE